MNRQILVLGLHRSGSSALAGVLHHLGIPMGPTAPAAKPSTGDFEDDAFVRLFNTLLGSWMSPQEWMPYVRQDLLKDLEALIKTRDTEHPVWGLKSPLMCFMGPWMSQMLSAPCVLWIKRNFQASSLSLAKRDEIPVEVATAIQASYFAALMRTLNVFQARGVTTYAIPYEDLVQGPREVVTKIVDILKLTPSDLGLERAVRSVRPDLKHF